MPHAPARPIWTAPPPSRSASLQRGTRGFSSCWATPSAHWNATCWNPCGRSGGRIWWASCAPRLPAMSCSCLAARCMCWALTTKSILPAFRALPSSMPTVTRSPPGTRASFRCSRAAFPARTAILTAPATRITPSTGSSGSSTVMLTFTVRPTPSTTTPPCRRSSWRS